MTCIPLFAKQAAAGKGVARSRPFRGHPGKSFYANIRRSIRELVTNINGYVHFLSQTLIFPDSRIGGELRPHFT